MKPISAGALSTHDRYLGRDILNGIALRDVRDITINCTSELLWSALSAGGRISATQMGIVGHSALSTPLWLLTVTGEMRKALFASTNSYRLATCSRATTSNRRHRHYL